MKNNRGALLICVFYLSSSTTNIQNEETIIAQNPYFEKSTFENFNFSGQNLNGRDFRNSNCQGANFSNTSCIGANFSQVNCSGASFKGANVQQANFRGTYLMRADFTDAITDKKMNFDINTNYYEAIITNKNVIPINIRIRNKFKNIIIPIPICFPSIYYRRNSH